MLDVLLLRRSIGTQAAERRHCVHCRRTPLIGEHVHIYESGSGEERIVCALCRGHRREAPARTELVHAIGERNVRVRSRRAAA
jgi:hypothetical protein